MLVSKARSRNGCYRCRARKIKCDEAQPECARCKSAGFSCPGYKSPNEMVFRSMNKKIEHKVAWTQAKREAASYPGPTQTMRPTASHFRPWETSDGSNGRGKSNSEQGLVVRRSPVVVGKRDDSPTLYGPMSTDWGDPALCRFFRDYVVEANEVAVSPGYLNYLPELYGEGRDEIITHAVTAVSLASFSNQVRSDGLLIRGRKSYGKALLLVKRALSNPKQLTEDGTLAGVFFLNMYEMISGDKPMLNQWGTHADALSMLLKLRANTDQFTSKRSGGIARGAHGVVIFKNLLRRIPSGPECDAWARSINPNEPWAQVGLATIRITRLIPMADEILMEETTKDGSGYRILQAINMLEAEDRIFQGWAAAAAAADHYAYGSFDRETLLAQGNMAGIPLPEVIHYYCDVWIAGFWNVYRFARVVLLQTLAQMAMRVSLYPDLAVMNLRMERIRRHVLKEVDAMVNDICSSIPYTLGKVDKDGWILKLPENTISAKAISGYTSVWPLRLALMVKTLTDDQKKYIFNQLAYIEGSLGIKQAKPNV